MPQPALKRPTGLCTDLLRCNLAFVFPFEKLFLTLQGVLANVPEVSEVGLSVSADIFEWMVICDALQAIAALLDAEFLSRLLHGYRLVFQ